MIREYIPAGLSESGIGMAPAVGLPRRMFQLTAGNGMLHAGGWCRYMYLQQACA